MSFQWISTAKYICDCRQKHATHPYATIKVFGRPFPWHYWIRAACPSLVIVDGWGKVHFSSKSPKISQLTITFFVHITCSVNYNHQENIPSGEFLNMTYDLTPSLLTARGLLCYTCVNRCRIRWWVGPSPPHNMRTTSIRFLDHRTRWSHMQGVILIGSWFSWTSSC